MSLIDTAKLVLFYKALALKSGGGTVEALGWTSAETQQIRFAVLAEIADLRGKEVLDAGCGHGDLAPFLFEKYGELKYVGVEQSPAFLDVAISRYFSLQNVTFQLGNFWSSTLPQADYVLASGSLSYRHSDGQFLYQMIEKLFAASRIGLAFNLLSELAADDGFHNSYNPQAIVAYCKTLTPNVKLVQGYLPNDFTVYMYR